jgi:predicted SprT family Zn-dependent metalloprotease
MNNLAISIQELYRMFDYFNNAIYGGQLNKPIITIASKRNAYGWCTVSKVWEDGKTQYYEIGITAEFLNRSYDEISETLMHEMVHLYNFQNGVKDCSGKIHNKKFKEEAQKRFLNVEKMERYGWAETSLTKTAKEIIDTFDKNIEAFGIYRMPKSAPINPPVKPFRYICPICETKIQSKDEIEVICKQCGVEFVANNKSAI